MIGRNQDGVIVDESKVVTRAAPGCSFHNYGMAVDSCFKGKDPYLSTLPKKESDEMWAEFGKYCVLHGLIWGGNFKSISDKPHAQISYGLTLYDVQQLWKFGGLSAIFYKVDQIIGEK